MRSALGWFRRCYPAATPPLFRRALHGLPRKGFDFRKSFATPSLYGYCSILKMSGMLIPFARA